MVDDNNNNDSNERKKKKNIIIGQNRTHKQNTHSNLPATTRATMQRRYTITTANTMSNQTELETTVEICPTFDNVTLLTN